MPIFGAITTACDAGANPTFTGPNASGANLCGKVTVATADGPISSTTVTWDGATMTEVGAIEIGADLRCEMWILAGISTGATTIAVTGGAGNRAMAAEYFTEVNQSTPNDTASTATPSGNPSLSVATTTSDGLVTDSVSQKEWASGNTAGAGQTERADFACHGDLTGIHCSDEAGTGSAVTMSHTTTSGEEICHIGVNLRHDAGGAAATPKGPFGMVFHGPFGGPL